MFRRPSQDSSARNTADDSGAVAFGHRVTFKRDDGRPSLQEDEADPRNDQYRMALPSRGL
jgi:hypothetical protein